MKRISKIRLINFSNNQKDTTINHYKILRIMPDCSNDELKA